MNTDMNDDIDEFADWDKCEEFSKCKCEDELDTWETATIPVFNQEHKKLEERKLVEEADIGLSKELFLGEEIIINKDINTNLITNPNPRSNQNPIEKVKPPSIRSEIMKKQKKQAQIRQKQKEEQRRKQEIYGEATIDKYDELYGDIAN
jgi:hypothetical protein